MTPLAVFAGLLALGAGLGLAQIAWWGCKR